MLFPLGQRKERPEDQERIDAGLSGASHAVERRVLSGAEEYVAAFSTGLERMRLRPTPPRMQHVLDCYPRKYDPVKMNHEKQCLLNEEPAKFEDMDTKEYWREVLSLAEER